MIRTLATLALLAAPAAAQMDKGHAGMKAGATAIIKDARGRTIGTAKAMNHGGMLMVEVKGRGMPAGTRAVHVHTMGKCEAKTKFETAGPHWNTAGKQHGAQNPQGPHDGDMPNMNVMTNGMASYSAMISGQSVAGLLDADGSAVIVHEAADDYRTDPTGNAGGRIACGVFRKS